ncbi:MAG: putative Response regulator containing a CheY-like receiver domain and an DNA-binding domain [Acidimicrobiales bacterium]|jgi:DNA-binding NarL/FixJ family response regulator|nr:putative Response regulator containing a CheY-like receiver domain and an DNA-binding domain [Acidimicrobiales bacterium]
MSRGVRVVVADADTLIRSVLRLVLGTDGGVYVVGETSSGAELIALCAEEQPDVVIAGGLLADGNVEDHLDGVLASGARAIVLCDDPSPERLTSLLARGASGYLLYDTAPSTLTDAIVSVAAGAAVLHPTAAGTILQQWRRLRSEPGAIAGGARLRRPELTPREADVLSAMADGLSTKAVARRLGVAMKTVENHKIRIFDKLGVRTQAHAVSIAIGHGLLLIAAPARATAASVLVGVE